MQIVRCMWKHVMYPFELLEIPESHIAKAEWWNMHKCYGLKSIWIGQSAAKPRTGEGSTTIGWNAVRGQASPKWRASKLFVSMMNDIVWTHMKVWEALCLSGVANLIANSVPYKKGCDLHSQKNWWTVYDGNVKRSSYTDCSWKIQKQQNENWTSL